MQNTHDLKEGAAKPGDFRDNENVILMHPLNEGAKFAVRELLGGADCLLNPAVNRELFLRSELEDFKSLVFRGLLVG